MRGSCKGKKKRKNGDVLTPAPYLWPVFRVVEIFIMKRKAFPPLCARPLAIIFAFSLLHVSGVFAAVRYVKPSGNDANAGNTWITAYATLQKALAVSVSGDEIWVAAGTYYPDEGPGQTNNARTSAFVLKNGVAVYGGFNGTEMLLTARPTPLAQSILSGDLMQNDGPDFSNNGDNSYHVVFFDYANNATRLDGFTITKGNGGSTENGGGIYNNGSGTGNQSVPVIANCVITGNEARNGAGIFNDGFRGNSSPKIQNCLFLGNKANRDGGGAYNFGGNNGNSSPEFSNCAISGNKAFRIAGGIFNDAVDATGGVSSPSILNCSFSGNQADFGVGGVFNDAFTGISAPLIANCIFWGNAQQIDNRNATPVVRYSIVQGGYPGTGNLDIDPRFISQPPIILGTAGDLRLQACSPAIDAGLDADNLDALDLAGNLRKVEAIAGGQMIDMGAYEYQSPTPIPTAVCKNFTASLDANGTVSVSGNDVNLDSATPCSASLSINGQPSVTFTCANVGPNTATLTVFSAQSNRSATCQTTVTVVDNIVPSITCPPNRSVSTDLTACTASVTYNNPTATDNCMPPPTIMHVSGGTGTVQGASTSTTTFGKGITTVTWKTTDASNNTKTCTFRIVVNDLVAPTLTCATPVPINAAAGLCSATYSYTNPTFTDNCPLAGGVTPGTAVRIAGLSSGSAFPVGSTNVIFQATDAMGNTKRCTMTVTVVDNQLPVVTCPPPVAVDGSGTPCTATVFYATPTASDNCAPTLAPFLFSGLASGSVFPAGSTTNTWRAIAPNGQTADCSFTVTVNCPSARNTGTDSRDAEARTEAPKPQTRKLETQLFPNPAAQEAWLNLSADKGLPCAVRLLDTRGILAREYPVAQTTAADVLRLDLDGLPPGLYLVQVQVPGKATKVLKLAVGRR